MIEDHIAPAVVSEQAIYRGEIDARLPVGIGNGSWGSLDVHGAVPPSQALAVYGKGSRWRRHYCDGQTTFRSS
jgi:hypothetical protein